MIEQNLAVILKDSAEEIRGYQAEIVSRVPEAGELCAGLDRLTELLERQSQELMERKTAPAATLRSAADV